MKLRTPRTLGPVNHRSAANDIVDDDQTAPPGELERPREVIRVAGLVGINEDQVKWAVPLGGELRQGVSNAGPRRKSTVRLRPARASQIVL